MISHTHNHRVDTRNYTAVGTREKLRRIQTWGIQNANIACANINLVMVRILQVSVIIAVCGHIRIHYNEKPLYLSFK